MYKRRNILMEKQNLSKGIQKIVPVTKPVDSINKQEVKK
jgi:hypothetical protein